ncbi:Orn/Lys/Arg family decarboxylase [Megalodesulfovibrio paquesii]
MDRRKFFGVAGTAALTLATEPALSTLGGAVGARAEAAGAGCCPEAVADSAGAAAIDRLPMRALLVDDELQADTPWGRATRELVQDLIRRDVRVLQALRAKDALDELAANPAIDCVLLDWALAEGPGSWAVLEAVRARSLDRPVFLLTDQISAAAIPGSALARTDGFIVMLEDTTGFISGRVVAAIMRYRAGVLPPMFKALVEYSQAFEYSWHTPGHTGGTAFLKSPAGRAYFEFFGESLLRSDLSISVEELGSLLDHSGPIGEGERNAARVFGAHQTYFVTNGSSTSNRVILMASVTRDQVALCDRNCHKSVEHAMTMSGAIPTYLIPSRNGLGIIGPIPPKRLTKEALRAAVAENPMVTKGVDPAPVHAVITNSTYDGLCYNVAHVETLLGQTVDRLHFDEAWYGYARFHPMYRQRFAMHGDPADHTADRPTTFATQSTHKLLAALSQASMIHVRDGRSAVDHSRFNESFMMHASTSPLYPLIASLDVSAAMMDGPGGLALTSESIREAVDFRQTMARLHAEHAGSGDWFFAPWQPEAVTDPATGRAVPFQDVPPERLAEDPSCWVLRPGAAWHGFADLQEDYCMLDPIKVTLCTPGASAAKGVEQAGIPACIVAAFLDSRGVVVEKTADFTLLFLFSMGVTRGKWGTLINALYEFKRHYDANTPLKRALPALMEAHGARYAGMGLKDLGAAIFTAMRTLGTTEAMAKAFSILPRPKYSPVQAYERLVRNQVETVRLDGLAGRVVATGVVPYPPGIPLLMPGELAGPADGPVLAYLRALEAFDRQFPGFTHETHGVEVEDGAYKVVCLKG